MNDARNDQMGRPTVKALFNKALRSFRPRERLVAKSGLLDESWYLANNPDAAVAHGGPLRHYMRKGARALRDPNPYFHAAWYCAQNTESRRNPLVHYLRRGAADGLRPSPAFDPTWYRTAYPDVAAAGEEPLGHFLRLGKGEGRLPKCEDFRPVEAAALVCLKRPAPQEATALLVTHAPGGRIKPHVPILLSALAREGVATILIVAADQPDDAAVDEVIGAVGGLYVRKNEGYDFAAWAHVLRNLDLSRIRCLILVNDSVVGPLNADRFAAMFDRIRASSAQLIGLCESLEFTRHFQSFFLVAKGEGVATLSGFLSGVGAYPSKQSVIIAYEMSLLRYFVERGLKVEALFTLSGPSNPTLERWRDLIEKGFPFVKVAALQAAHDDWPDVLRAQGYDPGVAERTLALLNPSFFLSTGPSE